MWPEAGESRGMTETRTAPGRPTATSGSLRPPPVARPPEASGGAGLQGWVVLFRPWFWPVAWGPALIGLVLGSGAWPRLDDPRVLLAALVTGPLVWGCVLLANDSHDLASDRSNPRKAGTPLVRGTVDAPLLARVRAGLTVASVGAGLLVSPLFGLGTAFVLALGWAYSCPPLRLKARPGADVAVNALAIGVLAPLGGWSLVQPVGDYPIALALFGLLVGSALYLPTTVIDRVSDHLAGDTTFAVRFGERTAYRLGVLLWCAAVAGWLAWCRANDQLGAGAVVVQVILCTCLVPLYAVLVARPSITRLAVVSAGFAVSGLCFVAACVG